jgi:sigma-E factor negative regulatory protein RseB
MKLLSYFLLLITSSFSAITLSQEQETAKLSLERLSQALQQRNFSTSFVVVKNNQAEPYHWFHGVSEAGIELEILALLNGPRRDKLRKGDIVSYIEPELPPYSLMSEQISGPIPSVLSRDISALESNYDFISVGRSRVLGRGAQLIRIVSKDQHRYGHWLWLDQETGLLLKLALINNKGQMLEQVQFTHLDITDSPAESLQQLMSSELPKVIDVPDSYQKESLSWQVNWLPTGFNRLQANRHRIPITKQAVEFMLFNDGLVDVSVYVAKSQDKQRAVEYVMDGATLALNQVVDGFEVSVVGKIPVSTAKLIANSVTFR